ncbi:Phosphatidylethanolamine binding protein [Phytophthora cinnamomi]|uniref:Phosphatidylethanolamine binding protein n=1 Tax=Phytophthora cinnamomi TaxID=4785 RepID=UPI00355971C6|nr:Phosphatidylethanolamine binding protein [Phytophthora cinnamomi]
MSSYGSRLPPSLLAPASFSLRGAGYLVATAFLVSMVFMAAVMQSVGVDGIAPNQLRIAHQSLTTLRLAAVELDTDSTQILQQWNLQLSDNAESDGAVQLSIAFNSDSPVTSGQYVPMSEAQEAPSVSVEGGADDGSQRYTYILVDIDAPDPKAPTHAPFLHYILAGLTAGALDQQQEVVVVPYYPVTPPIGEHRYISLLFRQQDSGPDAPDAELAAKRSNFDVAGFVKTHKLELVTTSSFHSHPATQDA